MRPVTCHRLWRVVHPSTCCCPFCSPALSTVSPHRLWSVILASTMLFPPLDNAMASAGLVYLIEGLILSYAVKLLKPHIK